MAITINQISTLGFGMISIFNTSASTSLLIAFKSPIYYNIVLVCNAIAACSHVIDVTTFNLQIVGIENFELLDRLKFIDLKKEIALIKNAGKVSLILGTRAMINVPYMTKTTRW